VDRFRRFFASVVCGTDDAEQNDPALDTRRWADFDLFLCGYAVAGRKLKTSCRVWLGIMQFGPVKARRCQ
jgi:hypothetical protein